MVAPKPVLVPGGVSSVRGGQAGGGVGRRGKLALRSGAVTRP